MKRRMKKKSLKFYKNIYFSGQQSHSSKHPCHLCTGFREDQHGRLPGDERGRWQKGEHRTYNSNMAAYNAFKLRTEGMPWDKVPLVRIYYCEIQYILL